MQSTLALAIDEFVFNGLGYGKPPVLALDPMQSQIGLQEFYKVNSPTTVRIRDSSQLEDARKRIDTAIKYVKPVRKAAGYAKALIEGFSVSQEGLSLGLNGILNLQPPSAASAGLPSVYIVEEDAIQPAEFADFISRFQQLHDEKKPRILMVADTELDSVLQLAGACGDNISAHVLSSGGLTEISTDKMTCETFGEFIDLFLSEGDGYCTSTDLSALLPGGDREAAFNRCTGTMLQIQSLFRSGRKFKAAQDISTLAKDLRRLSDACKTDAEMDKVLSLKAICNLWTAYISEADGDKIENSLSIAEHLGDDLLSAYALKLIPIVTGRGELTHQMLEKAKAIFEARGELEQAVFVENNIVDNNVFSDKVDAKRAERLSRYIAEEMPYIRRSTTFHSNAAIALMLTGNLTRARELFDIAVRGSGPAVNLLTSEINALIADHLDGEQLDEPHVLRIINKIERSKIDPNFDYHQAVMYGNLWKICEDNKDLSGYIIEILKRKMFLDYEGFLDDPYTFVKFATTRSYNLTATQPAVQPGIVGAFVEEHGLMPATHVFYR